MGMYDDICVKAKLPLPKDPKGYESVTNFQTKDLENYLNHYEIKEDKTLWLNKNETKYIPGDQKSKNFFDRLGKAEVIKSWQEFVELTGTINFYTYIQSTEKDYDYSIEYQAVFIKGKMKTVKLVEFEATNNAERKQRDKEFAEKLKKRIKFEKTMFYKYFVKHYNKLIRFISIQANKIGSFISLASWKFGQKFRI